MKKKIIVISSVLLLFVLVGFVLSENKKAIDAKNVAIDRSAIQVAVTVAEVSKQKVSANLELPATLEPSKEADIAAVTSGKITSLRIALGSVLSTGQVIGTVDTRQQQINLKDAKEVLAKAQKDYQLNKDLFEGNAGTAQSVKDAERILESARIKLSQVNQQLGDAAIKAPINGVVTAKSAEVGEYINIGAPIAKVVDIYNLKAVVFVSEKDVYRLKLSQNAEITADVLQGKSFGGKISYISPVGDENHNYRVELTVSNKSAILKAGTYIKVNFNLGVQSDVLQIPKIALVEGTKNPYVYVVSANKAVQRVITVGREFGEQIEVLGGLDEGDEVIVTGQINLTSGSKIKKIADN
ncbi:efflux RND transporter periplasmic adaptor subunit [Flavobacterium sufflavum]|uniref:Efflux RND transporter periplasmic adaptor subunit n=1 Tax=Flavobacterium sufflavum TaxID=1921138 RepID=A0A437L2X0_9FLAO|nr:efflux RND transporter periplasmic adaptor subunit [Flavobacterium sufflavum]RVT79672.1 efflux RND transporter periplasmic adaptor subunit [Flavobacterium sufflavum]